jgi:hypothetical protein
MPKKKNEERRVADNSENKLEALGKERILSTKSGQKTKSVSSNSKAQSIRHPRAGKGL